MCKLMYYKISLKSLPMRNLASYLGSPLCIAKHHLYLFSLFILVDKWITCNLFSIICVHSVYKRVCEGGETEGRRERREGEREGRREGKKERIITICLERDLSYSL